MLELLVAHVRKKDKNHLKIQENDKNLIVKVNPKYRKLKPFSQKENRC